MPHLAEECMMYDPLFFDLRKLVQTYWIIGDSTIIQEKKTLIHAGYPTTTILTWVKEHGEGSRSKYKF